MDDKWSSFIAVALTAIEEKNQRDLYVFVPEFLQTKTGVVDLEIEIAEVAILDSEDNLLETEVQLVDTIHAWYMGTDPQADVPDIHVGEQIQILYFSGNDSYYWVPYERNRDIRFREHIRLSAADEEVVEKVLTDDNTYYLEIDTKYNKHIVLSTADSDGEAFRYLIEIDAILNTVTIKDNDENIIQLDSNIPRIYMENKAKSIVDLNVEDIIIQSENTILIKSGDVTIETEDCLYRTIGDSIIEEVAYHKHSMVEGECSQESKEYSNKADKVEFEVSGDFRNEVGTYFINGSKYDIFIGGMGTISCAALDILAGSGEFTVNGVTHSQHVHVSNGKDEDTSKPKG